MKTSFYSEEELVDLGFKSIGDYVLISRFAQFYHPENIIIGSHVRIDDFCILSAGKEIIIGNYVHIACYSSILGAEQVLLSDYSGLSGRVSIYSSTDDYLGSAMTNPTIPAKYTNVQSAPVFLGKHVIIGAGSVILPGISIGEGAAIGALSLVSQDCEPHYLYTGNPARKRIERKKRYLELEILLEKDGKLMK